MGVHINVVDLIGMRAFQKNEGKKEFDGFFYHTIGPLVTQKERNELMKLLDNCIDKWQMSSVSLMEDNDWSSEEVPPKEFYDFLERYLPKLESERIIKTIKVMLQKKKEGLVPIFYMY